LNAVWSPVCSALTTAGRTAAEIASQSRCFASVKG